MARENLAPAVAYNETVVTAPAPQQYISWPAIFAGNAVTGGSILVLLPLGASLGLSAVSPYAGSGVSAPTFGLLAVLWLAFVYLYSIGAGAYIAGRLRPKTADTKMVEAKFRDGISGLVFWGVGMIISAVSTLMVLSASAGKAVDAAAQTAGPAAVQAIQTASPVSTDYFADLFLRSTAGSGSTTAPANAAQPKSDADVRAEITRILAAGAASGKIDEPDRQYLATLVAQRTGLSEADARTRVNDAITRVDNARIQAAERAKAAADSARKTASRAAFWVALLSFATAYAAWYFAQLGGKHRDQGRYA